ncbi:gephyrin-like molybdotransferase Glp [Roseivivax sp. THAF30]|uniref:molybdopterin molybdotransferase MoeA n=1 Tax=Roseivivax sp. THAF30 TaxID=2587852 RepID=UPI001267F8F2|nr:gephyrin-like molybdotransferase Glp [Roseivivax sp. THAF30]QFT62837.1 Molybdopterin molybdenumtransferase [Roseivivax sp. THAF30]
MISVAAALEALFELTPRLAAEAVSLREAAGRVLTQDVVATRDQPPFPASAMDGYATAEGESGTVLRVVGEAAAGHRFARALFAGEAVRIFTGAPVPDGADRVVIQEDVERDGDEIRITETTPPGSHIRPSGTDFLAGARLTAPRRLSPSDIALLASMNAAAPVVARKPRVAIIATGDELVSPGEMPGPDQIIASNTYGLAALFEAEGAEVRLLPIARDTRAALGAVLDLVGDADLVITVGGASVGDHDLVASVSGEAGLERAFYKVAMRPGKPLMAGRLGAAMMIGLPGNPVSAMVCGHVFVAPVLRAMQGLPAAPAPRITLPISEAIEANGPREHYMRAKISADGVRVLERQDSSLLSVLSQADALVIRPPHDPARNAGSEVDVLHIG